MMQIIPISAFKDNYIWVLRNALSADCVVVDPGDAAPVLAYLSEQNLQLTAILLTHHHADHCGGVVKLLEHFNIPVYGPARESISSMSQPVSAGHKVELPLLNINFNVLDIPGHTAGHVAYYGSGSLFCGDTLFLAGCGRLFEGTAQQMFHSLSILARLPDETLVYCGHEYTLANLAFARAVEPDNQLIEERIKSAALQRSSDRPTVPVALQLEKATNPFLRCHIASIKQSAEKFVGKALEGPADVFQVLRQWKDYFRG